MFWFYAIKLALLSAVALWAIRVQLRCDRLRCERDLLIALERLGGAGRLSAIAFEAGLTMREADVAAERLRQSGILATAPDEATTSLRSQSILRWAV
jgi:hypothetical protein